MKCKIFLITLLFFLSVSVFAQTPAATVPQFSFLTAKKIEFTNKDLAEGTKLFFVFFDTECDHCQHVISYIDAHYGQFSKANIYLVTLDAESKTAPFFAKYASRLLGRQKVMILLDYKSEFIKKFTPRKYPSLFIYSAQKKLLLYSDDEKQLSEFVKVINKS